MEQNVMQKYFTDTTITRSQTQNFEKHTTTTPFKSQNTYSDSNFGFPSPTDYRPKMSEYDYLKGETVPENVAPPVASFDKKELD